MVFVPYNARAGRKNSRFLKDRLLGASQTFTASGLRSNGQCPCSEQYSLPDLLAQPILRRRLFKSRVHITLTTGVRWDALFGLFFSRTSHLEYHFHDLASWRKNTFCLSFLRPEALRSESSTASTCACRLLSDMNRPLSPGHSLERVPMSCTGIGLTSGKWFTRLQMGCI